jgi:hypothetical protein
MPDSVITGSPEAQITGFGKVRRPILVVMRPVIAFTVACQSWSE